MIALVKMKRMILCSIAQKPEKRSDPTVGPAAGAIGQVTMMALVEIKKMILWSVAQELSSKSDPTLGPETASAIGQGTKVVSSALNVVDGPSLLMMIVVAMIILFFFTTTRLYFSREK